MDIVDSITDPGLVVVELCGGLLAANEACVRSGVKIKQLHVCGIDSQTRRVALARLNTLAQIFLDLLMPLDALSAAFACFHRIFE